MFVTVTKSAFKNLENALRMTSVGRVCSGKNN